MKTVPQHPDAHVRRAVRVLAMVCELHKHGYQSLRVMPYIGPTGAWRCSIAPVDLFYRNHGAVLLEPEGGDISGTAMIARYTIAAGNHYFDWDDASADSARLLADKFTERFALLADSGRGWDYAYAGWYQRLLGYAEGGWLPYVFAEYEHALRKRLYLQDTRPLEPRQRGEEAPILPLPPPGGLQQDYGSSEFF